MLSLKYTMICIYIVLSLVLCYGKTEDDITSYAKLLKRSPVTNKNFQLNHKLTSKNSNKMESNSKNYKSIIKKQHTTTNPDETKGSTLLSGTHQSFINLPALPEDLKELPCGDKVLIDTTIQATKFAVSCGNNIKDMIVSSNLYLIFTLFVRKSF